MAVIGIDLGTTNSLVSVWQNGEALIIPDPLGNIMQPSIVAINQEGKMLTSWAAKEEVFQHPECGVSGFKRDMGSGKEYRLGDKAYRSEELSAMMLQKLKGIAEDYLKEEVEEAIISVPAYFDNEQRYATKVAAKLAGIKCQRILNEPSAAALAARYQNTEDEEYMLVFDFGGGTLDVSIVDCFENLIEITAISGDNKLGGRDFDACIARYYCEKNNISWEDMDSKMKTYLLQEAQNVKETLTYRETCSMRCHGNGAEHEVVFDEKLLFELGKDLFDRIKQVIERAVFDSGLSLEEISKILLVGGSSKMPVIQKYLKKLFGREVDITGDAEELVAKGVGVYTAIKTRQEEVQDIVMTDVCPFSLGTDVIAYNSPETNNVRNFVMIERNSVLPARVTDQFWTTKDGQQQIVYNIYQGENFDPRKNTLLGKLKVEVPPDKAGVQSSTLTFTYDLNGILLVEAVCDATGEQYELMVSGKLKRMNGNKMNEIKKQLKSMEFLSEEEQQKKTIFDMGNRLYENTTGELRSYIENILIRYQMMTASRSRINMRKVGREVLQTLLRIENELKQSVFDMEKLADIEELFENKE